jgi:hypothetical protein
MTGFADVCNHVGRIDLLVRASNLHLVLDISGGLCSV